MRMPVSSPWAPAAGCTVTPGMPVIVLSASSSSQMSCSAPWTWFSGCRGWIAAKPGISGRHLVEARVVLHGARPERVETLVNRVVELAEAVEVLDHLHLAQVGIVGVGFADEVRRQDLGRIHGRDIERRQEKALAPDPTGLRSKNSGSGRMTRRFMTPSRGRQQTHRGRRTNCVR